MPQLAYGTQALPRAMEERFGGLFTLVSLNTTVRFLMTAMQILGVAFVNARRI
jgi:hypothetical protein